MILGLNFVVEFLVQLLIWNGGKKERLIPDIRSLPLESNPFYPTMHSYSLEEVGLCPQ